MAWQGLYDICVCILWAHQVIMGASARSDNLQNRAGNGHFSIWIVTAADTSKRFLQFDINWAVGCGIHFRTPSINGCPQYAQFS